MNLVALQLKTTNNYQSNLKKLIDSITHTPKNSFILASELMLTGYSYENLSNAALFSQKAIDSIKELSSDKIIALTFVEEENGSYFNRLFIFANQKIVHKQSKIKLFSLNNENKFFMPGKDDEIKIIEINGLKIASLICFELRFLDFWQKIEGADIILIPAMWGKNRKEHFISLSKSLAIMNQCFVIVSDSGNIDMAKSSGIITPFGIEFRDDRRELIIKEIDFKEITKMRRYLDVGLDKKRYE